MKKIYLLLSVVILSVALAGCTAKNNSTENNASQQQSSDLEKENEEIKIEEIEPEAKKPEEPEVPEQAVEAEGNQEDAMISESDYIAKVKKIKKGKDSYELKVLESLKGNLNTQDVPNADKLLENRAYLVFLKDKDGNVVFTNEAEGLMLLEGDHHEIFEKINKHLHQ